MVLGAAIGTYLLVAGLAMIPTRREQRASRTGRAWRLAGLAACLLWPLTVAAVAVAVLRERRRDRGPGLRRPGPARLQG